MFDMREFNRQLRMLDYVDWFFYGSIAILGLYFGAFLYGVLT